MAPEAETECALPYVANLTATIPAPVTLGQPCVLDQTLNFLDDAAAETAARRPDFKQTHIVCTLGPASRDVPTIRALLRAGMGVARFNFSHGSHEYHQETLEALREACALEDRFCAVLLDTKGPEVRTGTLKGGGPVTYEYKSKVTVTSDSTVEGDEATIALSYANVARDVKPGNKILMADGTLILEVLSCDEAAGTLECECQNTATIGEKKNCNLPGVIVDLPVLTAKDKEDLAWGVANGIDFVAASFVRKGRDLAEIREALGPEGKAVQVISKVENYEALDNIDDIIRESDAIMVARGDLGMEVPLEKMFHVQKVIIHKCNQVGKPVVTATQMLESMCNNPRPTRAEATDVANAVLDGTDCVMLSGETAAGKFPLNAVEIMSSICKEAEACVDNYEVGLRLAKEPIQAENQSYTVLESLASSAVSTAARTGSPCIVVLAATGVTARLIAKYRPKSPVVVGVVPREGRDSIGFAEREKSGHQVARQCLLTKGLVPVIVQPKAAHVEPSAAAKECVMEAIAQAKAKGLCQSGDNIVAMYNVEKQCAVIRIVECP